MYSLPVKELSAKSKHLNVFKRSLVDYSHNVDLKQMICIKFHICTQTILMYESSVKV